jgi:hypothetical protein
MALSTDNIKTIRQYADTLEKWAKDLSYDTSAAINLWSELTLSLYPQDLQGIATWLGNISPAGQTVRQEIEELSKLVQEIDAWRNQGIYPEDLGEFCARIHQLMKVAGDIISTLRTLAEAGEGKPTEIKIIAVEKSKVPGAHTINPPSIQSVHPADKQPSKEALMAYKLRYEDRLNIQQIVKRMTAELKLDKAVRPWQISRWIKQVERLHKQAQIPIRSIAPRKTGAAERSAQINSASQTGAKKHSRPERRGPK